LLGSGGLDGAQKEQWGSVTLHRTKRGSDATGKLRELLEANRRGKGLGIYSICSANQFVLEAGMIQATRDQSLLLIESTSNQVNQFGGYTGQTPADFVKFVHETAAAMGFPRERIVLGGDHLGPHVWRNVTSSMAMEKARDLVGDYVRAGFSKIHLDASMPCADDKNGQNRPLSEEIVCARAADLCQAAENAHRALPRATTSPLYVIGTEVPIPGGEQFGSHAPEVTQTKDLARTLDIAKKAFLARGLGSAWERVIAIVVQPGVEFGDATVFPYDSRKAKPLARFLSRAWTGVYEAHSTDYQPHGALWQMVSDHFAILKVGPWLTFALREAVFALAAIEQEWLSERKDVSLSRLREVLEKAMLENPVHWKNYYHGNAADLHFARNYSYSDRVRYYWPQPVVAAALQRLIDNLTAHPPPASLLSQYLPFQAESVSSGELVNRPAALIRQHILEVIDHYAIACGMRQ
jgi:D-tagatose-1,6-bisphosphate aldolase subunit GatZ/KbaZ